MPQVEVQCLSSNFAQCPGGEKLAAGKGREACLTSCVTLGKLLHLSSVFFFSDYRLKLRAGGNKINGNV